MAGAVAPSREETRLVLRGVLPGVQRNGRGRNRYRACEIAGVEPRFVAWDGSGGSATLYAVSKNLHRRHLTLGQRTAIGVELTPMLEAEAAKRQEEAGKYGIEGGRGNKKPETLTGTLREGFPRHSGEAAEQAAKAVQVSASSISRAKQVKAADPEAFERVKRGESTVNAEVG